MAVVSVAACVFLVAVWVGQGLVQASLWAAILAALAAVVAVVVAVWALPKPPQALVPPELEVADWVGDRPVEPALGGCVVSPAHGRRCCRQSWKCRTGWSPGLRRWLRSSRRWWVAGRERGGSRPG